MSAVSQHFHLRYCSLVSSFSTIHGYPDHKYLPMYRHRFSLFLIDCLQLLFYLLFSSLSKFKKDTSFLIASPVTAPPPATTLPKTPTPEPAAYDRPPMTTEGRVWRNLHCLSNN